MRLSSIPRLTAAPSRAPGPGQPSERPTPAPWLFVQRQKGLAALPSARLTGMDLQTHENPSPEPFPLSASAGRLSAAQIRMLIKRSRAHSPAVCLHPAGTPTVAFQKEPGSLPLASSAGEVLSHVISIPEVPCPLLINKTQPSSPVERSQHREPHAGYSPEAAPAHRPAPLRGGCAHAELLICFKMP